MADTSIKVEGLGKKYSLTHQVAGRGLRHVLQDALSTPWKRLRQRAQYGALTPSPATEEFWALRDVSFEVNRGDALGIIGRNGAGKSTLLKVLSRITEPTTGEVKIDGRVASLLEVGTGFHYELTGRENIFLNGTILGMTRREIARKFDEIVAFAEIEQFLDTPVKHYSSGMYVRLAFAVAAHLEPEILIVDEVLAVGDIEFQKKCLGKMEDVSRREGRTVLFISHNMTAISALTNRVILLKKGRVAFAGSPQEGIQLYMSRESDTSAIYTAEPSKTDPKIIRAEIICSESPHTHESGKPWKAKFVLNYPRAVPKACFSFQIINQYQSAVLNLAAYDANLYVCKGVGTTTVECEIPSLKLNVGPYHLKIQLSDPPGGWHFDTIDNACPFDVVIMNKMSPFGWRPDACTYFESSNWSIN